MTIFDQAWNLKQRIERMYDAAKDRSIKETSFEGRLVAIKRFRLIRDALSEANQLVAAALAYSARLDSR